MNKQLPIIIIQIATLVSTVINCTNFSLQYSRYRNEIRTPIELPVPHIRTR